jgi:hypothetical protein
MRFKNVLTGVALCMLGLSMSSAAYAEDFPQPTEECTSANYGEQAIVDISWQEYAVYFCTGTHWELRMKCSYERGQPCLYY